MDDLTMNENIDESMNEISQEGDMNCTNKRKQKGGLKNDSFVNLLTWSVQWRWRPVITWLSVQRCVLRSVLGESQISTEVGSQDCDWLGIVCSLLILPSIHHHHHHYHYHPPSHHPNTQTITPVSCSHYTSDQWTHQTSIFLCKAEERRPVVWRYLYVCDS